MKKSLINKLLFVAIATATAFSSCKDKDPDPDPTPVDPNVIEVSSNIESDQTWESGKTYKLTTRVAVTAGNTLTIEPGVVVKGAYGTAANATALIIARGARIMANGTATQPIIFTGSSDEITPGNIMSPNLDATVNGLWGGLIILGNAPISADAPAVQIEGIPPSDPNGLYGGTDPVDNSGELSYVSIRHGGANIGQDNEINGLTLGGVGSGTSIHHIEIVSNQDDGIEFFGGTVNVENLLVTAVGDDAVDVDQAWSGTLDNFIVICAGGDHALEIDGPEGTLQIGGTVRNGSLKGDNDAELADFRDDAMGLYENLYFFNFPDPGEADRGDLSLSSGSDLTFGGGLLNFDNLEVTLPAGVALDVVMKGGVDAYAMSVALKQNTVGADKSEFASWTLTDAKGQLDEFK